MFVEKQKTLWIFLLGSETEELEMIKKVMKQNNVKNMTFIVFFPYIDTSLSVLRIFSISCNYSQTR